MDDFRAIKEAVQLEQFITANAGGQIKKTGSTVEINPCPGCGHKNCFKVFPASRSFKCFSCGMGGDLFNFVEHQYKVSDKYQILVKAAELTNYTLKNSDEVKQNSPLESAHKNIFKVAADYYNILLLNDAEALKILSGTRNYTSKTVKEFLIGYTGPTADGLYTHLKEKNYSDAALLESGLVKERNNKLVDYFVPGLFVFPHLLGHDVCDFTIKDARKHEKKAADVIAYRLESAHRRRNVYFYNQDALYYDDVIIVEGEHDAIQMMRALNSKIKKGSRPLKNVLAITGNPSGEAMDFLERAVIGKNVFLGFDLDSAGQKYREMFFLRLWGNAAQIRHMDWDAGMGSDLDEYLRNKGRMINDHNKIAQALIDDSENTLQFLVSSIEDSQDRQRNLDKLSKFTKRLIELDDHLVLDYFLAEVNDHFAKGKFMADVIRKHVDRARLDKLMNADYLENLPFFEQNGCYYHKMAKGPVNLSNFRLVIKDLVLMDDEMFYRCDLKSVSGEVVEDVEFTPAERVDVRKFRTRLVSKGAFHFTGRDNELSGIWQYEESKHNARYIKYVKSFGRVQNENLWLFDNCAISDGHVYKMNPETEFIEIHKKNYKSHGVQVYSGATPKLNVEYEYNQKFTADVADAFHQMLDTSAAGKRDAMAGYLFMGFLPATIYSDEIFNHFGFFPFLFSYGPSGTGKTAATSLLLSFFGFQSNAEDWTSASPAGTYMFIKQLSSLPCWYDEFLNDNTFKSVLGVIKNIYNRVAAGKGGLKETRTVREVKGTLWLSGEDNPANEAVLSRSILFRFTPLNAHKNRAYKFLMDNKDKLSAITKHLLMEKNDETARTLLRDIKNLHEYIMSKSRVDPRVAANHAIVAAGLNLLGIEVPEELHDYCVLHAERTMKFKEEENPRNQFFAELNHLYMKGFLKNCVRFDALEKELCIRAEDVIREMELNLRKRGKELKIKSSSIVDYLKDTPGYMGIKRKYFNEDFTSKQQRCMVFNVPALPENIRESMDDLLDN